MLFPHLVLLITMATCYRFTTTIKQYDIAQLHIIHDDPTHLVLRLDPELEPKPSKPETRSESGLGSKPKTGREIRPETELDPRSKSESIPTLKPSPKYFMAVPKWLQIILQKNDRGSTLNLPVIIQELIYVYALASGRESERVPERKLKGRESKPGHEKKQNLEFELEKRILPFVTLFLIDYKKIGYLSNHGAFTAEREKTMRFIFNGRSGPYAQRLHEKFEDDYAGMDLDKCKFVCCGECFDKSIAAMEASCGDQEATSKPGMGDVNTNEVADVNEDVNTNEVTDVNTNEVTDLNEDVNTSEVTYTSADDEKEPNTQFNTKDIYRSVLNLAKTLPFSSSTFKQSPLFHLLLACAGFNTSFIRVVEHNASRYYFECRNMMDYFAREYDLIYGDAVKRKLFRKESMKWVMEFKNVVSMLG